MVSQSRRCKGQGRRLSWPSRRYGLAIERASARHDGTSRLGPRPDLLGPVVIPFRATDAGRRSPSREESIYSLRNRPGRNSPGDHGRETVVRTGPTALQPRTSVRSSRRIGLTPEVGGFRPARTTHSRAWSRHWSSGKLFPACSLALFLSICYGRALTESASEPARSDDEASPARAGTPCPAVGRAVRKLHRAPGCRPVRGRPRTGRRGGRSAG
jgi:hypothetical protein